MPSEQEVRVFVGLEMPREVTAALAELQRGLAAARLPLRMVRPEGIHLTLAFLGEMPAGRVGSVTAAAQRAAAGVPRLELRAADVGAFPNVRRPRAIWVGVEGDQENRAALQRLNDNVARELRAARFSTDSRFDPHLTIARVRERASHEEVAAISAALQSLTLPAPIPFTIDAVYVIRSVLQAGGSVYSHLAEIQLAEA